MEGQWAGSGPREFPPQANDSDQHQELRLPQLPGPLGVPVLAFLSHCITPLYEFYRDARYELVDGRYVLRHRDHLHVVGYDDMNQLFWYRKGLERLRVGTGPSDPRLMDLPPLQRYTVLNRVDWPRAFAKTYRESRNWFHVLVNFNRVWVIHLCLFWYYTSFHLPTLYVERYLQADDTQPTAQTRLAVMLIAGVVALVLLLTATVAEFMYVPRSFVGAQPLFGRFLLLSGWLAVQAAPIVYLVGWRPLDELTAQGTVLAGFTFVFLLFTSCYLAVVPLVGLCGLPYTEAVAAYGGSLREPESSDLLPRSAYHPSAWPVVLPSVLRADQRLRRYLASYHFTASHYRLQGTEAVALWGLWVAVFVAKLTELYFFLAVSFRSPVRELSTMGPRRCVGDWFLGLSLCRVQPLVLLLAMYVGDVVLFCLDTYLWYIVCNTVFLVCLLFYIGVLVWTPWRNVFLRLPKRIYSKVLSSERGNKPRVLVLQIWNLVVVSMYRDHLILEEVLSRLMYNAAVELPALSGLPVKEMEPSSLSGEEPGILLDAPTRTVLKEPLFFAQLEDLTFQLLVFEAPCEAQRRILFFAQLLSTPMRDVCSAEAMPLFLVLVPHYSEKILLLLREIIKEEKEYSSITLLEYLKLLHPVEWGNFVADTKQMAMAAKEFATDAKEEEEDVFHSSTESTSAPDADGNGHAEHVPSNGSGGSVAADSSTKVSDLVDDLPFFSVGFKTATPEYVMRTRIWALLRLQTLFRTISGFMNYLRAIKLLYDVEHREHGGNDASDQRRLEAAAIMTLRKFRLIVLMQRMHQFVAEEAESRDFLLRTYPELQIAYLDSEECSATGRTLYFSCLIDGSCDIDESGRRLPKFRIQLSGNPILGDGKLDNQNHALVFCRGEYIQLVDANQDNYLEECLKIRLVLAEFDELTPPADVYLEKAVGGSRSGGYSLYRHPVAIIGTREYIFSENIGVLGDVAAGKEQTFGTLFARTLAQIGGKLHYGHPDFLNAVFMTTRGGVSKAQRGLHLNEDIYAGMTAVCRGGRIKHCEYMQCGKGRDLGFGSILNFTTKIGAGMGEQMLSREYYYLGTQLPLDRFLSFYYAHPGFHLNNVFIMLLVQLFMAVLLNLAALTSNLVVCEYSHHTPITDPQVPEGCVPLAPVLGWVTRFVLSVFVCFFILFVPLVVQELMERGVWRALGRLSAHLVLFAPCFEVFVCQIYAQALRDDLVFGGAKYISTGRGMAMQRVLFVRLYAAYAPRLVYPGALVVLVLLIASLLMWQAALLWFWHMLVLLVLLPFLFNPHQFVLSRFLLDYREYVRWLTRGNSQSHPRLWVSYTKSRRGRLTGYRRIKKSGGVEPDARVAHRLQLVVLEVGGPLVYALLAFVAFAFVNTHRLGGTVDGNENSAARLGIITLAPVVLNAATLVAVGAVVAMIGPLCNCCCGRCGGVAALTAHVLLVVYHVAAAECLYVLEGFLLHKTLTGLVCGYSLLQALFRALVLVLAREHPGDGPNHAFWSGVWYRRGLGLATLVEPLREWLIKVVELLQFAADAVLGHLLMLGMAPLVLVPGVDRWHLRLLLWVRPESSHVGRIVGRRVRRTERRWCVGYGLMFCAVLLIGVLLLVVPVVGARYVGTSWRQHAPAPAQALFHTPGTAATRRDV